MGGVNECERDKQPSPYHIMTGAQVRALYGSKGGGGLGRTQIAVCTIEKANALVNRLAAANVSPASMEGKTSDKHGMASGLGRLTQGLGLCVLHRAPKAYSCFEIPVIMSSVKCISHFAHLQLEYCCTQATHLVPAA